MPNKDKWVARTLAFDWLELLIWMALFAMGCVVYFFL
jgi:hypothetical protein